MGEKEFVSHDWANRIPVSIETMGKAAEIKVPFIPAAIDVLLPQVESAAKFVAGEPVDNIYLIGCGDSLYASVAARMAFDKYSGYRVEVVESLEFSRYVVPYLPKNALVIGVSSGGGTSRTIEGVLRAKKMGAKIIGITATLGSRLKHEADASLIHNEWDYRVQAPPGEGTFSLNGYTGAMLALFLFALALGREKDRISSEEFNSLVDLLYRSEEMVADTLRNCQKAVEAFAHQVADQPAYFIMGGGPNYATALYSAAKLFEMPQVNGVPVEIEEWAHEQYFLTREGTVKIFVVPPGNSVDRAHEQIAGALDMGAQVAVVCSNTDTRTQAIASTWFGVSGDLPEEFSPIIYCVPGELFALYLCKATGKPAFAFVSQTQFEVNKRQVGQSKIVADF